MKVLSDIYTYSKDKSSAVFSSNSLTESKKQKKKVDQSSWFSKTWVSTSSLTSSSSSWFNTISLPKYKIPKLSFPKMPTFSLSFPKYSFPKCSFPKFPLPTVWIKSVLVKLEETRVNCYLYLVELFKILKEKSSGIFKLPCLNKCLLNCSCLQFNSNPEYVKFPWYRRVFFTARDNVNAYISLYKGSVVSYIYKTKVEEENEQVEKKEEKEAEEEEEINFSKKGSKAKLDRERSSRANNSDDKYGMKHSQSSKYSNDLTTLRSSKKLKKTNTDDLKNSEDNESNTNIDANINSNVTPIKHNRVFSMFSKTDIGNKSSNTTDSLINKYSSLYIGKNDEKTEDTNENKNITQVPNDESIPGSNETTTESSKFNIKKTWDKFSKIIS